MDNVQRYLTARVIGHCEVDTVLLGFDMCRSSHSVLFLPTNINNRRFVLKQMDHLPTDNTSTDIYCPDAWEKYLDPPSELSDITYYELFKHYRFAPPL